MTPPAPQPQGPEARRLQEVAMGGHGSGGGKQDAADGAWENGNGPGQSGGRMDHGQWSRNPKRTWAEEAERRLEPQRGGDHQPAIGQEAAVRGRRVCVGKEEVTEQLAVEVELEAVEPTVASGNAQAVGAGPGEAEGSCPSRRRHGRE